MAPNSALVARPEEQVLRRLDVVDVEVGPQFAVRGLPVGGDTKLAGGCRAGVRPYRADPDVVAFAAPDQFADVNEGPLRRHHVAIGLLRIPSHGAQTEPEIEHLHRECDSEECADGNQQRGEDQHLVAERRPVVALPLLGADLGFGLGLLDDLDRQRLVDHPDRQRPRRQLSAGGGMAVPAAGCDGGAISDGSGCACATETPAANSARAIPRHAQTTRNMLLKPRNTPQRGVIV